MVLFRRFRFKKLLTKLAQMYTDVVISHHIFDSGAMNVFITKAPTEMSKFDSFFEERIFPELKKLGYCEYTNWCDKRCRDGAVTEVCYRIWYSKSQQEQ